MARRKEAEPVLKELKTTHSSGYKYRVYYTKQDGTRTSSRFKTQREAASFLEVKSADVYNLGTAIAATLDDNHKRQLYTAVKALEPYGKTVNDAVAFYVKHLEATERSKPIDELYDDFIEQMSNDKLSVRYISDLKSRLKPFVHDFGDTYANQVSTLEVQSWLRKLKVQALTRNHYRRVLSAFFSWCLRLGYATENPIEKTDKAKANVYDVQIFTVEEMCSVLKLASDLTEKDILATVCIGGFAGLRMSEISRLDWSEVHLEEDRIVLPASKTKKNKFREISIMPVLREWIENFFSDATGIVQKPNYTNRLKVFRDMLKRGDSASGRIPIPWPQNGLRHSFASYLMKYTDNDQSRVGSQLGHTDLEVLQNHYRELVKKSDAEAYWNLGVHILDQR